MARRKHFEGRANRARSAEDFAEDGDSEELQEKAPKTTAAPRTAKKGDLRTKFFPKQIFLGDPGLIDPNLDSIRQGDDC